MEYTNEPMKLAIDKARDTMNKNFVFLGENYDNKQTSGNLQRQQRLI